MSNLIINTEGVLSLIETKIVGLNGTVSGNEYSSYVYVPSENLDRGMYFPPPGGIFEVKYPNIDIVGRVV
jgi:hypothetical protein